MRSKILCIFDGFGLTSSLPNNVPAIAKMPNFRRLFKDYWWTTLDADGENVGQERGLVGNSEVGHMNLGGLKLVPQLSYQITKTSEQAFDLDKQISPDQLFDPKKFLKNRMSTEKDFSRTIHLVGLFSTGTIHSDLRHWIGAIEAAGKSGMEKIILHIISDGRDSDRQSLVATWDYFVEKYKDRIEPFESKIFLGSVGGRFYAMDRDNNWERVKEGLEVVFQIRNLEYVPDYKKKFLVSQFFSNTRVRQLAPDGSDYEYKHVKEFYFKQLGRDFDYKINSLSYLKDLNLKVREQLKFASTANYNQQFYDENIHPMAFDSVGYRDYDDEFGIKPFETVWLLNFRTDRMKQFTQMLCDINQEFELNLTILGMNDYGIDPKYIYFPIFKNQPVQNTLAQKISENGQTQLHIAETEKYNHVTYFLNGGQNKKWPGEDWVVIDSNKVISHAEKPAMKAKEITNFIIDNALGKYDYIIVNYANPDMLGHTGDILAATQSLEILDQELGRLVEHIELGNHTMILTADHGNIEHTGQYFEGVEQYIDTKHNPSPVPLIIVDKTLGSSELKSKLSILNIPDLDTIFSQQNQLDLGNSDQWFNDKQIPKPVLPLWYAGIILLNL